MVPFFDLLSLIKVFLACCYSDPQEMTYFQIQVKIFEVTPFYFSYSAKFGYFSKSAFYAAYFNMYILTILTSAAKLREMHGS